MARREGLALLGGGHAPEHGGLVDQVERAPLVVLTPAAPVGDAGGEVLQVRAGVPSPQPRACMMRAMDSDPDDPAAQLADELRGAIEELSSVAHDPERVAQAVDDGGRAAHVPRRPAGAPLVRGRHRATVSSTRSARPPSSNQSLYRGAHNPLAPPMSIELVEDEETAGSS